MSFQNPEVWEEFSLRLFSQSQSPQSRPLQVGNRFGAAAEASDSSGDEGVVSGRRGMEHSHVKSANGHDYMEFWKALKRQCLDWRSKQDEIVRVASHDRFLWFQVFMRVREYQQSKTNGAGDPT